MSQLVDDGFDGATLDAQWTTDHANGGGHSVASGSLTLSTTSTAGSRARIRTAPETMADGDTLEVSGVSIGGANFSVYILMRDNIAAGTFVPGLWLYNGNWNTVLFRDSTGGNPITAGPSIASRPRARLRRSAATLVAETWDGSAWVSFGTLDNTSGGGAWTPAFSTARAELMVSDIQGIAGPASLVVGQVGDGVAPPAGLSPALIRRRRG